MKRLAIITTHPIQYNAPLFRLLSQRKNIEVKVFYTWGQSESMVFDARFGIQRSWDIPLLNGYQYEFVRNTSSRPDSNRFWGVVNPGFLKRLNKEQFDAVLVYRWSLFSHLVIMQRLRKQSKLFFRGDSHLLSKSNVIKGKIRSLFLKCVYRKVDVAFYVGKHNKEYYLSNGFTESRLREAGHAVDNLRFSENAIDWEEKAAAERLQLQIPKEAIVFLYAGKFYEVKQLDHLINSFKQLEGNQYRLLLVGNGEQESYLKELAQNDERILFLPFRNQSDMPLVYRLGDVFVLPSKSETWGLSVNEAMACKRPAIVSNKCGCAPELIVNNRTGYVFDSSDLSALIHSLRQYSTRETAFEQGEQAFSHIQRFSLENVAAVIEKELMK